MGKFFEKSYTIRVHEVDFRGLVKIPALLNLLQDMASLHASKLGFSVQELFKQNRTWVLSRSHLKIIRIPRWNEPLMGRTWPSARDGFFALRDFQIKDQKDELVAVATSSWMMLDLSNKRPIRVENVLSSAPIWENRALQDDFPSLPQLEEAENEAVFRVRWADLDANRHVNHVIFVDWALEAVPAEILWKYVPIEIEVSYRAEALYGGNVVSRSRKEENEMGPVFIHQLMREADGKEIARLRTFWRSGER